MEGPQLVAVYFERPMSGDEFAALCQWLNESPANARFFVEWSVLEDQTTELYAGSELLREDKIEALERRLLGHAPGASMSRQREADPDALLEAISELDQAVGPVTPVKLEQGVNRSAKAKAKLRVIPPKQPRVLVIPWVVVWSAAAAVILLVAWLGWIGHEPDRDLTVADDPGGQADESPQVGGGIPGVLPPVRVGEVVASLDANW